MEIIKKFYFLVNDRKLEIFFLISLTVLMSILEITGIAMVGSYIAFVANPESLNLDKYFEFLNFNFSDQFLSSKSKVNFFGLIILSILFIRFFLQTISNYFIFKITSEKENSIRKRIINIFIKTPYIDLTKKDTSELNNYVSNYCIQFSAVFINMLTLISNIVFLITFSIALIFLNFKIFFALSSIVIILFIINNLLFRKKLNILGHLLNDNIEKIFKMIKEVISGIKELFVLNKTKQFFEKIIQSSNQITKSKIKFNSLLGLVKYFVEFFLASIIILLILYLENFKIVDNPIEVISIFGIAAIRSFPLVNSSLSSLNSLSYSTEAINGLNEIIEKDKYSNQKIIEQKKLDLEKFKIIKFTNLTYSIGTNKILKNIDFELSKGEIIGITGESGSGKTTLANIIVGLIKPDNGKIYYNEKKIDIFDEGIFNIKNKISYLSQESFIFNDTIKKNISLNLSENDENSQYLKESAELASIDQLINNFKKGFDHNLGESGSKISGGQRQRIALARAFYANREIMVLDEFTNSLDAENEKKIIEMINRNKTNFTFIIISHKLSTLRFCSKVYELKNGILEFKKTN